MAGRFTEAKNIKQKTEKPISYSVVELGFYGRVSKEEENQLRSIKNQKDMFGDMLEGQFKAFDRYNQTWRLYDFYLDEGITGLNTKKRFDFKRFMKDARNDKFKIAVIKSISRFGRNMSDTCKALDELLTLGIRVIFLEDNMDSSRPGDMDKFGLFAWLAELESKKISDRVNMTFNKMKRDGYYFGSKAPFGYNKKDGKLFIKKKEAKIIKLIYNLYLNGLGANAISTYLRNKGIKAPKSDIWSEIHIKRILSNPVYIGTTYTNQSSTIDIKNRIRKTNDFNEWIQFENSHDAIIDKDTFNFVQTEIKRRGQIPMAKNSEKHLFSNLLQCGHCGHSYVKKTRKLKNGTSSRWTCWNYDSHGKEFCVSHRLKEEDIIYVVTQLFNELNKNKDKLLAIVKNEKSQYKLNEEKTKHEMTKLQNERKKWQTQLDVLLDLHVTGEINKSQYLERSLTPNKEIDRIKNEIQKAQMNLLSEDEVNMYFGELVKDIDKLCDPTQWSNQLLKKHIYKIIINNKEDFEIILNINKATHSMLQNPGKLGNPDDNNSKENTSLNNDSDGCRRLERGTLFRIINIHRSEMSKSFNIYGYFRIAS